MAKLPNQLFRKFFPQWYRKLLNHPKYRMVFILGSLIYLLSPVDLSPDVFPVVGWIDDGLVATLLMGEVSQLIVERKKLRSQKKKETAQDQDNDIEIESVTVDPKP